MSRDKDWVANFDECIRSNLINSAQQSYSNGASIIDDSKVLLEAERYMRAVVLAILAQEELSKAFILLICAMNHRWDSAVHGALRHHGHKQAIVETMAKYVDWFKAKNKCASQYNQAALIPIPFTLLPDQQIFQDWIDEAKKATIKKGKKDKYKQRLMYVGIDKMAKATTSPSATKAETESEILAAEQFKSTTKIILDKAVSNF